MSSTLVWEPTHRDKEDLSNELKGALRKEFDGESIHAQFTEHNLDFLRGLRAAGIKDAQKLIKAIKKCAFRGKVDEIDCTRSTIEIKVSSIISKKLLEEHLKTYGVCTILYEIKLLGLFECWFPRYQGMNNEN